MSRPISSLPLKYQDQAEKLLHGPCDMKWIVEKTKSSPELKCPGSYHFEVAIEPIGKPRMTQRDKWKKRPVVMRYRAYADALRLNYRGPLSPTRVSWKAYFTLPPSWSKAKKLAMAGTFHQAKPDRDNVDKGILDALFAKDQCIAFGTLAKYWDDGKGARIELEVTQ